jgi:hypothetical protein
VEWEWEWGVGVGGWGVWSVLVVAQYEFLGNLCEQTWSGGGESIREVER